MPPKQVTLSARISHEDAAFISQLSMDEAKTPSDKLRCIISEARQRRVRKQDYAGGFQMIQEIIAPVLQVIRKTEVENKTHSELLTRLAEWMPDLVAFLVSSAAELNEKPTKETMLQIEQGVAERLFRQIESVLQLALTGRCACYDPDVVSKRIGPVLELAQIILAKK